LSDEVQLTAFMALPKSWDRRDFVDEAKWLGSLEGASSSLKRDLKEACAEAVFAAK